MWGWDCLKYTAFKPVSFYPRVKFLQLGGWGLGEGVVSDVGEGCSNSSCISEEID